MSSGRISLAVAAGHPAFAGHFPGAPIVPGVVLLDEALHAIGTTLGMELSACTIGSAKFLHPVGPGDVIELQYEVAAGGTIRFEIVSAGRKIASGVLNPQQPACAP